MVLKRNVFTRGIVLVFCLFLAVLPFFQPKKVQASPLLLGITALLTTGMIAGRYVQTNVLYTPEQMNQINEKWTENLQTAFPDPADYNHQMNVLQNLNQKLLNGEEVDWSKYSGKALYAVLKGVVDVVWPYNHEIVDVGNYRFVGACGDYALYNHNLYLVNKNYFYLDPDYDQTRSKYRFNYSPPAAGTYQNFTYLFRVVYHNMTGNYENVGMTCAQVGNLAGAGFMYLDKSKVNEMMVAYILGLIPGKNTQNVPNVTAKTANKVKLPTRLPQTVINNINSYIDNSTENLIIAPTPEELPQLPEGYNPNTDELPDLPGYEDVTPDQEPITDPEPTPTPPDPTPTPPEYNGDEWVNPIGNFFDGLLKFMKAAFIPTLSLNLDALNTVPDNLGSKFPFCLPGDIVNVLTMFVAEPQPPPVKLMLPFSVLGGEDQEFEADISVIDDKMETIRTLIFLMFLVGLAWFLFDHYMGGDS